MRRLDNAFSWVKCVLVVRAHDSYIFRELLSCCICTAVFRWWRVCSISYHRMKEGEGQRLFAFGM